LENLSDGEDINRAWENIKETINTSAKESLGLHELKQNEPWFDEECLGFIDQRKQVKMQWVQDPSQSNVDNINNVRHETSRHFKGAGGGEEYLKAKIQELETNRSKILGTCIGASVTKKGYQPRTNIVKVEKGDLVTDSHSILARWRNHFSQLLNVYGVNDVRQTEIHTAELLVPEPSAFEF